MFLLDTAASDWARHLPRWFVDAFEQITNFGLSGWFLFPFGFILLCLAAVTVAGAAAPDARRAGDARGPVRISVSGDRRCRDCSSPSSSA